MNKKLANWMFLAILLFELVVIFGMGILQISMGILPALILNQLLLLIPATVFLVLSKTKVTKLIPHNKIKVKTILFTILFTALCSPMIIVTNMISMLFVDNVVNEMSVDLINLPMLLVVLVIGILGPANEEFIFRGVIFNSYRKEHSVWPSIILSAVLFGLMHLNFNQLGYAIVVGIFCAMLLEVTQSIFSVLIFHGLINTTNVVTLFTSTSGNPEQVLEQQLATMQMSMQQYLLMAISIYLVLAAIGVTFAIMVLHKIAKIENQEERFQNFYLKQSNEKEKEKHSSIITIPIIIAIILAVIIMVVMM